MTSMKLRRSGDSPPPGLDWETRESWQTHNELTDRHTFDHDGSTFFCRGRESTDRSWRVAYGSPIDGADSRVFLFSNGGLQWTRPVESPIAGLVSDHGTIMILCGGTTNDLDGSAHVFDSSGDLRLEDSYRANVADGDLSADGSLAVVQTHPPDNRTFVYDLEAKRLVTEHSSDWAQPTVARFGSGDSTYIYLSTSHGKRPLYALDREGSVVWESERHRKKRPLFDRIRTRLSSSS